MQPPTVSLGNGNGSGKRAATVRALILSAGQGRRLLPLTENRPKCLLEVEGRTLLDWQLCQLEASGFESVSIVVGFGADQVREQVEAWKSSSLRVELIFNPFYREADNLVSCWIAREAMHEDFVLLNGDTLVAPEILGDIREYDGAPVVVGVNRKSSYDADDMKVELDGDRLLRIGKKLPVETCDGESIGLLGFRGDGPGLFRAGLERKVGDAWKAGVWYLSVIDELAGQGVVRTLPADGLGWVEVDYPKDLREAARLVTSWMEDAELETDLYGVG